MVSEVLVGAPLIEASKMQTASTGVGGTVVNTRQVQRVSGVRSMSTVFLRRLAKYLDEKGFGDAVPEVLGWLEPKKHKAMDPQATMALLARIEASIPHVTPREAAYLEAANFCVAGWSGGSQQS